MPTVFRNVLGYKVYFWSNENDPREPVHVHVGKRIGDDDAKFWILRNGQAVLDKKHCKLNARDLRDIQLYLSRNGKEIIEKWQEYLGDMPSFIDCQFVEEIRVQSLEIRFISDKMVPLGRMRVGFFVFLRRGSKGIIEFLSSSLAHPDEAVKV